MVDIIICTIIICAIIIFISLIILIGYDVGSINNISALDMFLMKRFSARKAAKISKKKDKKSEKEELYFLLRNIRESANNGYISISTSNMTEKNVKILKSLGYVILEYESNKDNKYNEKWYKIEWGKTIANRKRP